VQVTEPALAPEACIVCGKERPRFSLSETNTWVYLAGAKPLGSMACSPECAVVAVERFQSTGRCDARGMR
jgi:hypothetical protein